jgi:hypothetical protein
MDLLLHCCQCGIDNNAKEGPGSHVMPVFGGKIVHRLRVALPLAHCIAYSAAPSTMPELPELRLAAQFISRVCKPFVFKSPLQKSAVSKNAEVQVPFQRFTVSGQSRGKELLLLLADATQKSSALKKKAKTTNFSPSADPFKVVFRFGMRFDY